MAGETPPPFFLPPPHNPNVLAVEAPLLEFAVCGRVKLHFILIDVLVTFLFYTEHRKHTQRSCVHKGASGLVYSSGAPAFLTLGSVNILSLSTSVSERFHLAYVYGRSVFHS